MKFGVFYDAKNGFYDAKMFGIFVGWHELWGDLKEEEKVKETQ